jgi:hypothetical protein
MKLTVHKTFAQICIVTLVSLIVGLTALDSIIASPEPKRVFVLNSFNRDYPWTENMLHGIDDTFSNSGKRAVVLASTHSFEWKSMTITFIRTLNIHRMDDVMFEMTCRQRTL